VAQFLIDTFFHIIIGWEMWWVLPARNLGLKLIRRMFLGHEAMVLFSYSDQTFSAGGGCPINSTYAGCG